MELKLHIQGSTVLKSLERISRPTVFGLLICFVIGCGDPVPTGDATGNADGASSAVDDLFADVPNVPVSWDPNDERVVKFIEHLKQKGITLEYAGGEQGKNEGDWKLVAPAPPPDREVIFSIASFPQSLSEREVDEANLHPTTLYLVNTRAYLALASESTTMLRVLNDVQNNEAARKEDEGLPKHDGLPITDAVPRLFLFYRPDFEFVPSGDGL